MDVKHSVRQKGSVTVFMSIIITVILALICTVIESARVYATAVNLKSISYISLEAEFAGYARQVFEDYGVLLVWDDSPESSIESYVNLNCNGIDYVNVKSVEYRTLGYVTESGTEEFVSQILEYEKYEIVEEIVQSLINYYNSYDELSEEKIDFTVSDVESIMESLSQEDTEQLTVMAKECMDGLPKLKEIIKKLGSSGENLDKYINQCGTSLAKKQVKKVKKKIKKCKTNVNKARETTEDLKELCCVYITKKTEVLKKIKEDDKKKLVGDYIEDNLAIIEKTTDLYDTLTNNYLNLLFTQIENGLTDRDVIKSSYIQYISKTIDEIKENIDALISIQETEEDENAKDIFELARELLESGMLELVLPKDMKLSTSAIDADALPSHIENKNKVSSLKNIMNKALYVSYVNNNFYSFTNSSSDHALQYELEYILNGKDNDKSNLSDTVLKILGTRQIINTASLLADKTKMTACALLAASISGAILLPFLEPVIQAVLVEAWALVESVVEMRIILDGGKVPIIKRSNEWHTDLKNLATDIFKDSSEVEQSGIDYNIYLLILLLLENNKKIVYRTMDLMQVNIANQYNNDFKMSECLNSANLDISYEIDSMLVSLPFVNSIVNRSKNQNGKGYELKINVGYSY